jgi:hypothetical protein
VRRFWQGEEDKIGRLMHKPGGDEHARWVFDYDEKRLDDDEAGYRFGAHSFVPGEYVTIRDQGCRAYLPRRLGAAARSLKFDITGP